MDLSLGDFDAWLGLPLLALIDSTSAGTLIIPLVLLVTGRGSGRAIAARTGFFLLVIGAFYWALGVALLAGLLPLHRALADLGGTVPVEVALAVIGAGLIVWSYAVDPETVRRRGGDPERAGRRWVHRVRSAGSSWRVLAGLALLAGVIEAASMVPYLAAMGIIARSGMSLGTGALILLAYCALMILPGLLLAALRAALGSRADRLLERVEAWAVRNASSAFAWGIGIIGVVILVRTLPGLIGMLTAG